MCKKFKLAMRLSKSGNIQINRVYTISEREFYSFDVPISTPIQFVDNFYNIRKIFDKFGYNVIFLKRVEK